MSGNYIESLKLNTNESNQAYINALIDYGSTCLMAIKLNLSDDNYEVVYSREGYSLEFVDDCKTLDEILVYPYKHNLIHPDDREYYRRYVNIDSVKKFVANCSVDCDYWIRYRSKYSRDDYHQVQVNFFIAREFTEDNQVVYALFKDLGSPFAKGRFLFEEILKELSENFDSIYYVDFDNDVVFPYRMSSYITRVQGDSLTANPTYEMAIEKYIRESVYIDDQEEMLNVCSKKYVREQLRIKKAFGHDYRTVRDGRVMPFRVKFCNMEGAGEIHHVVIGFVDIGLELTHNMRHISTGSSILVADADENRKELKQCLDNKYTIYEASTNSEAFEILDRNHNEIGLIISGLDMSDGDGLGLLKNIKEDTRYHSIPVIVSISRDDFERQLECIKYGAADFIVYPFINNIVKNRIDSIIRLREVSSALDTIEIDELTGLYSKEAFYKHSQNIIDTNPGKKYVIEVSDVLGLKVINEQYGKEMGDNVLKYIANAGNEGREGFLIGGRLSGDVFACILPAECELKEDDLDSLKLLLSNAPVPNITLKVGQFYTTDGEDLTAQQMCDRAWMAMEAIKDSYGTTVCKYDESMRKQLLDEQNIIDSMEAAIKEDQFTIYYQPKYDLMDEKPVGAEALVRWIHPELGFMNPGIFIPLFERNGFITNLDKYIWRKVCSDLSGWIKAGLEIPVSINISRRDFSDVGLAEYIINLADEFGIPHKYLHIEVTESAYADNPSMLERTIEKLHESGFIIELDDFGTGYSSIASLNAMDIDILKLDMSIIRNEGKKAGKSVLEFAMQLAKMMKVKTIQEGVETDEQLIRVKSLGCDYVQGYYFSKPLPKDEFEKHIGAFR